MIGNGVSEEGSFCGRREVSNCSYNIRVSQIGWFLSGRGLVVAGVGVAG
jgi:hypothetical protein